MPNCPYCSVELAFCLEGAFCYNCERLYPPAVVKAMDGYDYQKVSEVALLYHILEGLGALAPGRNQAEVYEDGVIITPIDE